MNFPSDVSIAPLLFLQPLVKISHVRVARAHWCDSIGNMGQDSKLFIRGALDLKEDIESVS